MSTFATEAPDTLPLPPPISADEVETLDPEYPEYKGTVSYFDLPYDSDTPVAQTWSQPLPRSNMSSSLEYYYLLR